MVGCTACRAVVGSLQCSTCVRTFCIECYELNSEGMCNTCHLESLSEEVRIQDFADASASGSVGFETRAEDREAGCLTAFPGEKTPLLMTETTRD